MLVLDSSGTTKLILSASLAKRSNLMWLLKTLNELKIRW